MNAIEREQEILETELEDGSIDVNEYNQQMAELESDLRQAARESAQEAYDREMERW